MTISGMDENNREYSNEEITVYWYPKKCIHATTCYKELIEVFNPRNRPWVNMQGAPTDKITEVVDKCPTQALVWKWNKDVDKSKQAVIENKPKESIAKPEIKVMKNGPLIIRGEFVLKDETGKEFKTMKITSLCRCGESNNMPYCDGTHRKINFQG